MWKEKNHYVFIIILLLFLFSGLFNGIRLFQCNLKCATFHEDVLHASSYSQTGQIINNSYNWYRIYYKAGELIQVNASSDDSAAYTVGVIITGKPQPQQHIGSTEVFVGGILNNTQNVTLTYANSDVFQEWFGLYLLIISLNETNPTLINYTIESSHLIVPYSYDQYYNEIYLPVFVSVVVIVVGIAAVVTLWLLKRWRSGGKTEKMFRG
ncbi:MAG: hypothetical protein ACTSRS_00125 [Candidatus Helarchaeota archaeon]